jgi:hypothetical protein
VYSRSVRAAPCLLVVGFVGCQKPPPSGAPGDAAAETTTMDARPADAAKPDVSVPAPSLTDLLGPHAHYENLCGDDGGTHAGTGDEAGAEDASCSGARPARRIQASFRSADRRPDDATSATPQWMNIFEGHIVVPELKVDRVIFRFPSADPHQCCAQAEDGVLSAECHGSGIDVTEARASAQVENGKLVVAWCSADLSTGRVDDRGRVEIPLPCGATLAPRGPKPACAPPLPE